jgi:fructose-specific phosphotransferase system component IIB
MKKEEIENKIEALNISISKSVQSLKFDDGKEVVYRSVDEMIKARNILLNELSKVTKKQRTIKSYAIFNKGV